MIRISDERLRTFSLAVACALLFGAGSQSVHAADIGRLINPMQCRGQIDGAIAMGFGWALYEKSC